MVGLGAVCAVQLLAGAGQLTPCEVELDMTTSLNIRPEASTGLP